MTAVTVTLTEFLLARIAEDEAAARAATPAPWFATREAVSTVPDEVDDDLGATWNDGPGVMHASFEGNGAANAVHIARHDPARVLAECAAKRAIVRESMARSTRTARSTQAQSRCVAPATLTAAIRCFLARRHRRSQPSTRTTRTTATSGARKPPASFARNEATPLACHMGRRGAFVS